MLAEGQLAKLGAAVASANDNMKHGTAKTEVHRREVVAVAATTALVFGGVCCVCFCSCCCCCCCWCCAAAAAAALVCREHNFCSLELLLSTAPVLAIGAAGSSLCVGAAPPQTAFHKGVAGPNFLGSKPPQAALASSRSSSSSTAAAQHCSNSTNLFRMRAPTKQNRCFSTPPP